VVGPIAFVPFVFVVLVGGAICLFCLFANAFDWLMGDALPELTKETEAVVEAWGVWGFEGYVRFVPFAVAAWLFCRWGRRNEMHRWALAACSIVALIAGLVVSSSTVSHGENTTGSWTIGFAFHPNIRQLLQLAVPLAIAAWFLLRLPTSMLRPNATPKATAI
jgi:hypothetical protein